MTTDLIATALAAARGSDPQGLLDAAQTAAAGHPDDARVHALLAKAWLRLGQPDAAEASIARGRELDPASVPVWIEAAALAHHRGDQAALVSALTRLTSAAPQHLPFWIDRAQALETLADDAQTVAAWEAVVARAPRLDEARLKLALALVRVGRAGDALGHALAAARSTPTLIAAGLLAIELALAHDQRDTARTQIEAVAARAELDRAQLAQLVTLAQAAGSSSEVVLGLAARLAQVDSGAQAFEAVAMVERARWDFEAAHRALDEALRREPRAPLAIWLKTLLPANLPHRDADRESRFIADYRQGLARLEGIDSAQLAPRVAQQLLEAMTPFFTHYAGLALTDEQRRIGAVITGLARRAVDHSTPATAVSDSPLRVGVCSVFLHRHTVTKLFGAMIEALAQTPLEIELIHPGGEADEVTRALGEHAARYHGGHGELGPWAERIAARAFDLLIYLDLGMDALTLGLAALRLAPVQAALWGHPVTTGLASIDFFISSEAMEPPDGQLHYSETLHRLPGLGTAAQPPVLLPRRPNALSAPRAGEVTVFMPQMLLKVDGDFEHCLGAIARRAPNMRLMFTPYPHSRPARAWLSRLDAAFSAKGADLREHLRYCGWVDQDEWLGLAREADFALDSFRWSGGNSSLEMFAFDTPIVSLPGTLMRSRHTAAMLTLMEIPELIARDADDYVEIAVRLATELEFRSEMRARIGERKHRLYGDRRVIDGFVAFATEQARNGRAARVSGLGAAR